MKEPEWLLPETIRALQDQLIVDFGGPTERGEEERLDAALDHPKNLFAYSKPKLPYLAAAYASGLVRNRPFLDGNKRLALVAAVLFLERNSPGLRFHAPEAEVVTQTRALAERKIDDDTYAAWLEANLGEA